MVLSDRPETLFRDQAETQELQAGPYATCARFGPVGLVALMQGQAELPRALVRRITGARLGPVQACQAAATTVNSFCWGRQEASARSWPDVSAL